MKTLIAGAALCTLVAASHAEGAPDSWSALSSRFDARSLLRVGEDSFVFHSHQPYSWRDGDDWRGRIHGDDDVWKTVGAGDDDHGREGLDDSDGCAVTAAVPEPATCALFGLGAVLIGWVRQRATRTR
jgi:hypothetical protein